MVRILMIVAIVELQLYTLSGKDSSLWWKCESKQGCLYLQIILIIYALKYLSSAGPILGGCILSY